MSLARISQRAPRKVDHDARTSCSRVSLPGLMSLGAKYSLHDLDTEESHPSALIHSLIKLSPGSPTSVSIRLLGLLMLGSWSCSASVLAVMCMYVYSGPRSCRRLLGVGSLSSAGAVVESWRSRRGNGWRGGAGLLRRCFVGGGTCDAAAGEKAGSAVEAGSVVDCLVVVGSMGRKAAGGRRRRWSMYGESRHESGSHALEPWSRHRQKRRHGTWTYICSHTMSCVRPGPANCRYSSAASVHSAGSIKTSCREISGHAPRFAIRRESTWTFEYRLLPLTLPHTHSACDSFSPPLCRASLHSSCLAWSCLSPAAPWVD
ncbi:hypothetical protein K458DRAFT_97637 [Lentithecium fluviatile CBS 122367]|uniref:Uncharacterized protein n=1 Tax=Lentithecium fluviatile CBS 122367 TaxID=1168545 RepID=A0A6G1JID2_9PLEO|nr:hypothetical protein K458DRAFT_97637 [Lentithecium fluviatile CBS 122367]